MKKIPLFSLLLVLLVVIVVGGITVGLFSLARSAKKSAEAKAKSEKTTTTPVVLRQVTAPVPLHECETPCVMRVGWGETMSTGGRPVLAKASGKPWQRLSGRECDVLPVKYALVGEVEFASPKLAPPVWVRIFPAGYCR